MILRQNYLKSQRKLKSLNHSVFKRPLKCILPNKLTCKLPLIAYMIALIRL